jgi:tetratricopeptide (TPR) repeat protein
MAAPALCVVMMLWAVAPTAAAPVDALANARKLYNLGQYDRALEAAREAEGSASTASSARLVIGRIRLERYRQTAERADLEGARTSLRNLDARALDVRERVELQVGLAEVLYFDDRFGASAELLDSVLDSSTLLGAEGHERALDWWASALDRYAQRQLPEDRGGVYERIIRRMEEEVRQDASSTAASYWLVAASRGAGDLDRSWAAAVAGWVRAMLAADRGATLRADLDRLVTQALIPDRATRLTTTDRRQAMATMMSEWEDFKQSWSRQ